MGLGVRCPKRCRRSYFPIRLQCAALDYRGGYAVCPFAFPLPQERAAHYPQGTEAKKGCPLGRSWLRYLPCHIGKSSASGVDSISRWSCRIGKSRIYHSALRHNRPHPLNNLWQKDSVGGLARRCRCRFGDISSLLIQGFGRHLFGGYPRFLLRMFLFFSNSAYRSLRRRDRRYPPLLYSVCRLRRYFPCIGAHF